MPQVSETAQITGGDISGKAQKLWVAMRDEAVRRKTPQVMTKHGAGYYLIGTVQSFANRLWNTTPDLRSIRAFLKASGNIVVVEQYRTTGGNNESKIFVRGSWSAADAIPVPVGPGNRDRLSEVARKLTPHEAGEDREHAPVETTVMRKASPYVGPVPETILLADGALRCGACGYETKTTASMGSHKRKHYHERNRANTVPATMQRIAEPMTVEPREPDVVPTGSEADLFKETLRRAIKLVDLGLDAEFFLGENLELSEKMNSLTTEVERLRVENNRLVQEIRDSIISPPPVDPDVAQQLSAAESQIELIRGIVARYTRAEAGPVRTLIDIEDLLG